MSKLETPPYCTENSNEAKYVEIWALARHKWHVFSDEMLAVQVF